MLQERLNESENIVIGVLAAFAGGFILVLYWGVLFILSSGALLQPTLYWKNARAAGLPFTVNPKLIYRGTAASILNECQMMGLQFGSTSYFQRHLLHLANSQQIELKQATIKQIDLLSSALGGLFPSFITCPIELVWLSLSLFLRFLHPLHAGYDSTTTIRRDFLDNFSKTWVHIWSFKQWIVSRMHRNGWTRHHLFTWYFSQF
jgi:hypothetical protein